jgi:ribosomal 30S subunit maturation factor RimM
VLLQPFFRKSEIPPLLSTIYLAASEEEVPVATRLVAVRKTAAAWALSLPGVADAGSARDLTHHCVWVEQSVFLSARESGNDAGDELYSFEVEGIIAVDGDGKRVGTVLGFENFGGGDLLVIKFRGDSLYLPFTEPYVGEFQFADRKVVVQIDDFLPPKNAPKKTQKTTPGDVAATGTEPTGDGESGQS